MSEIQVTGSEDVIKSPINPETEMKETEAVNEVVTEPITVPVEPATNIATRIVSITCVADIPKVEERTSIASLCPTVMAALMSPVSRSLSTTGIPVIPGTKDSDGFLTPPPASTLLLRRTRTNSTGPSTYVIASSTTSTSKPSVAGNGSPNYNSPNKKAYMKRSSRDRDGNLIPGRSHKKPKLDGKLSTILSAPSSLSQGRNTSGQSTVFGNQVHPPYRQSVISPLALNPPQSLSVTITPQRSVSTFSPSLSPTIKAPLTQTTYAVTKETRGAKPQVSRGKPAYITEIRPDLGGKGLKSRPDNRVSEGKEGRRKCVRRKRFSLDKKGSRYRNRHHSESSFVFDPEHMGIWRPTDDLRLIVNILQTNDLHMVHRGIKFACMYTLANLEARWGAILYDPAISKVTQLAIQKLHPKVVQMVYKSALFSKEEHAILKSIKSTHDITCLLPKMEKLLHDNPVTFLKWRTPKVLYEEWLLLKECQLLGDQNVRKYFENETFARFEDLVTDQQVLRRRDASVRHELLIENRNARGRIRMLEEEVARWQLVADMVTEIEPNPFEEGSYAMLRGKQVRYLMRSREITLGRRTEFKTVPIDADLSLEGSIYKISRRQATIQLRTLGDFAIINHGKHAFFVDGNTIMPGKIGRLADQSVIEISRLRFIFLVNTKMLSEYVSKQIRIEVKREMGDLQKLARAIKAASAATATPGSSSPTSAATAQIYALAAQNAVVDAVLNSTSSGLSYLAGSPVNGGSTTPTPESGPCSSPLPSLTSNFMEITSLATGTEANSAFKSLANSSPTPPISNSRSQSPASFGSIPSSPVSLSFTPPAGSRSASPATSNASATSPAGYKSSSPAFSTGSAASSAEFSNPSFGNFISASTSSGSTCASPNTSSARKDSTSAVIEAVVSGLSLVPAISPLSMALTRPSFQGPIVRPYIQPPPYAGTRPPNLRIPIIPIYRQQPPLLPPPPPYPALPAGTIKSPISSPMQFGDLTIRPGLPPPESSGLK